MKNPLVREVFDLTLSPGETFQVQRSTNVQAWTDFGSTFTPMYRYHTRSLLPPPADNVDTFRLRRAP